MQHQCLLQAVSEPIPQPQSLITATARVPVTRCLSSPWRDPSEKMRRKCDHTRPALYAGENAANSWWTGFSREIGITEVLTQACYSRRRKFSDFRANWTRTLAGQAQAIYAMLESEVLGRRKTCSVRGRPPGMSPRLLLRGRECPWCYR